MALAAVMLAGCASCRQADKEESATPEETRPLAGGYTAPREATQEEIELFKSVCHEELTVVNVATQVVAGINYRFCCLDAENSQWVVVIYKPLPNQGEPRVTLIEKQ